MIVSDKEGNKYKVKDASFAEFSARIASLPNVVQVLRVGKRLEYYNHTRLASDKLIGFKIGTPFGEAGGINDRRGVDCYLVTGPSREGDGEPLIQESCGVSGYLNPGHIDENVLNVPNILGTQGTGEDGDG